MSRKHSNFLIVLIVFSAILTNISVGSGYSEDFYEENDNYLEATPVTEGYYSSLVMNSGDPDWYSISLNEGDFITINLYFSNFNMDLDLYLYYDGNIDVRNLSTSNTDGELITYEAEYNGIYYILVSPFSGVEAYYQMNIDINEYSATDDSFEQNDDYMNAATIDFNTYNDLVLEDSEDWYKIYLGYGEETEIKINFTHTELDLNLRLYDEDGTTLIDSSISSNLDVESIIYTPSSSGFYYIRVNSYSSGSTNYSLSISLYSDITEDSFEPNNDMNSAAHLSNSYYSNLALTDNVDWYSIYVSSNYRLTITVSFIDDDQDIDIELYDSNGHLRDYSTGTQNSEQVSYDVSSSQTYYLKIYSIGSSKSTYSISISKTYLESNSPSNPFWSGMYPFLLNILEILIPISIPILLVLAIILLIRKKKLSKSNSYSVNETEIGFSSINSASLNEDFSQEFKPWSFGQDVNHFQIKNTPELWDSNFDLNYNVNIKFGNRKSDLWWVDRDPYRFEIKTFDNFTY